MAIARGVREHAPDSRRRLTETECMVGIDVAMVVSKIISELCRRSCRFDGLHHATTNAELATSLPWYAPLPPSPLPTGAIERPVDVSFAHLWDYELGDDRRDWLLIDLGQRCLCSECAQKRGALA